LPPLDHPGLIWRSGRSTFIVAAGPPAPAAASRALYAGMHDVRQCVRRAGGLDVVAALVGIIHDMKQPGTASDPAARLDRIAVVSDVHGNVSALQAALADIEARGITRVVNLGDVVGKGPRNADAVKLARERCEVTVRGNWDAYIARGDVRTSQTGAWTRDQLSVSDLDWLAALPGTFELLLSGRRIRLFHASQVNELTRVRIRHTDDEFRQMFSNTPFTSDFRAGGAEPGSTPDVVGYGDIHSAYLKADEGRTLFNAGAVGNHLDAPSAPYVILEGVADSAEPAPFSVSFVRVDYDIEAEISIARGLGMPDVDAYARELLDGIYRGRG
jgi:predicted phosphodiesterase